MQPFLLPAGGAPIMITAAIVFLWQAFSFFILFKCFSMEKSTTGQAVPQLPVVDVEKTQIYYKEILGLDILWTYPDTSIGAAGRSNTTLFFAASTGPIEPAIHWIFAENVDLLYAEYKESGADITEEIENKPWNLRQFTVRDLNGHLFISTTTAEPFAHPFIASTAW